MTKIREDHTKEHLLHTNIPHTIAIKVPWVSIAHLKTCQLYKNYLQVGEKFNGNLYKHYSGAPAGAEGARGRSTIAIEIGNPSSRENLDVTSVRTSVRPYARIRAGDEFVFVLDLESFSGKQ